MKRTIRKAELVIVKRNRTLAEPPGPDDGLRLLGQLVGYSLVAASHRQGFLAGLQQIADDRKELRELRANWIVCPRCGRRHDTLAIASPHFPHTTTCSLRRVRKNIP
jgi:hypothetical protein